ncbi:hypothetical protein ACYZX9_03630 [Sphingomonas citri]
MRVNSSAIIAILTLALGWALGRAPLWLPAIVLAAAIVDIVAGPWARSARVGARPSTSIILKTAVLVIGFGAGLGQLLCIAFALIWVAATLT